MSAAAGASTVAGRDRRGSELAVYFAPGLADDGQPWRRVARLSSVVVLTALLIASFAFLFAATLFPITSYVAILLVSIGGSVVASTIVYALLSLFLEPNRQEALVRQMSTYAIAVAHQQFEKRFEVSLPTATYEFSGIPPRQFRDAFLSLLKSSKRYDHKGVAARLTTFWLYELRDRHEVRNLDQIGLCLLDPRADDSIRAHAVQRIRQGRQTVDDNSVGIEAEQIRVDVFVSLVAFFDIRSSLPTTIYLHRDLPFFRCDLLDEGMFLTYHLSGAAYASTLLFTAGTQPYDAYKYNLELTRRYASAEMSFRTGGPATAVNTEDRLAWQLSELGCGLKVTDLRKQWDKRHTLVRNEWERAGILPY